MNNQSTHAPMTAEEFYGEWIKDRIILFLSPTSMVDFAEAYHTYRLAFEKEQQQQQPVSERSELLVCGNCLNNHTNKEYEGYCSQSCFDGIK